MTPSKHANSMQTDQNPRNQETEYELLAKELTEKELELVTLENELSVFEKRYARSVGILFAELDFIEMKISRELLRLHPKEKNYQDGFQKAERKAQDSQNAVNQKISQREKEAYKPTEEIKNLFRKVAKLIHPDLSINEKERAFRTNLMVRANEAYKNGDKNMLKQILHEWDHRDEKSCFQDEEINESNQLEQKLAQIKARLQEIKTKIVELKKSEIYQLMLKVGRSDQEGRDLLGDMADELRGRILEANKLLESLKARE